VALGGRSILVVEDEPIIALDLINQFENAGAKVLSSAKVADALKLAERPGLAAAVLDYALADGDCSAVAARLRQRGVPFVIYSGFSHVREIWPDAIVISKPAQPQEIIQVLLTLIAPTRVELSGRTSSSAPDFASRHSSLLILIHRG
jgi:CheY-like chemotaxis protein